MWREKFRYNITDKTLVHIAALEKNIALISQNEINIKNKVRLSHEVLFDDLYALSNGMGLNLTLGDIKKISIGKEPESKEARLLSNVRQVFDYVQNNYKKIPIVFNFHLIQHVVKLLQSDILEVWDVGKIRTYEEEVNKMFELPAQDFSEKNPINFLAESVVWLEEEKDVHPIIKASGFLFLINRTSPFIGLNLVSSLLLFRLILEKYNYGMEFKMPLFKIFNSERVDLYEIINGTIADPHNKDISLFIESVSYLLNQVVEDYKNEHIEQDYYDVKSATSQLDLNDRQIKLLKLLQQKVNIKRREYIKLFKVSSMTAYRDLNYLVENKLLTVTGQGKSTIYTLYTKS
jgi:Fic family protein